MATKHEWNKALKHLKTPKANNSLSEYANKAAHDKALSAKKKLT